MKNFLQNESFRANHLAATMRLKWPTRMCESFNFKQLKSVFFLVFMMLMAIQHSYSQCYTTPNYCTAITAANNANFGMGIQRVILGTSVTPSQISNFTTAGQGTQIYFDYTNQIVRAAAGDSVYFTVRGGNSNQTLFRIYIDYDNNGTFATTAPELVFTSPNLTVVNTDVSGSFILPTTLTAGVYRIRVASDGQGLIPQPCGPLTYSAEYEDYTLLVPASTPDLMSGKITSPAAPLVGNNTVAFNFTNISTTTITSVDVYYQLNNNTPVFQSLSSLSIAPGATYTATFTTLLSLPSTGSYNLRAWTDNPNFLGNNTPANDTICRSMVTYCSAPLSGTYTINPTGTAINNFTRFGAADSALIACGVSGPVEINVTPGIYNENLIIPAIPGASATNTIKFFGGGATLQFNCDANNISVIRLQGAKHVTIDSLNIRTTNANFGWGVHFFQNADSNVIRRSVIDISTVTSSTANNSAGIVFSNSTSSNNTSGANGRFNTIELNTIKGHPTSSGMYYGIVGYPQASGTTWSNNRFLYNRIENFFYAGVNWQFGNRTVFRGNTITRPTKTSFTTTYAFYLNSTARLDTFDANIITNLFGGSPTTTTPMFLFYGINYSGSSTEPCIFTNNLAYNLNGNGQQFGFYFLTSFNHRIYNNTFNFDYAASTSTNQTQGLYWTGGTSTSSFLDFRNNIISITKGGSGAKHALFSTGSWATGATINNNAYFSNSTGYNLANYLGVDYPSLSSWKTAFPIFDQQSNSFSPNYVNASTANFSPQDGAYNGAGANVIATVPFDVANTPRALPMDIGAFEASPIALDAAMDQIVMPAAPYAAGNKAIFVKIRNAGQNLITSATINWTLNGVAQTPISFTDSLFGGTVSNNIFLDSVAIASNSLYRIVATISNPNGVTDPNAANNEVSGITASSVSGVITINNAATPGVGVFTNFTDFATLLQIGGLGGAVTANVTTGSGPYTEQVMFTQFPGTSAANTVTINGNGATLQFNNISNGSIGIFNLVGTDYCTINNLRIVSLNTSQGVGVILTAGANFNTIQNCTIDIGSVLGGSNSAGIAITGALNSPTATGNNGTNNLIQNNSIVGNSTGGPYFGISYCPTNTTNGPNTFNVIKNNDLRDFTVYGMYMMYTSGSTISGNVMWRPTKASPTTFYGIYGVNGMAQDTIENNVIKQPFQMQQTTTGTFYGYYFIATNTQATRPIIFRNNLMYDIKFNGTLYGYYQQSVNNIRIYNNTFDVDHAASTSTGVTYLYYNSGSPTGLIIRNNIWGLNRGGSGAKYIYYLQTTGAGYTINNNNVYLRVPAGSSNNFVGFHASNQTTWAAWRAVNANAYDQQGVFANPMFRFSVNPEYYMPGNDSLNNVGFNTPDVPRDYTGALRTSTPDIGAYEFSVPGADAALTRFIAPTSPLSLGVQNVQVMVKSFGTAALTSANLDWTVNGTAQTPNIWTGSIGFGDSSAMILGSYNFANPGFYRIKAWSSNPNTVSDSFPLNDTINVTVCTPLAGNYYVNPAVTPNDTIFNSLVAFSQTAQLCGVAGPITVNIVPGVYNGSIAFNGVAPGMSAINSITIVGADTATTRIVHNGSGQRATILMNGAKHIHFRNLSIENSASSGGGFGILYMNAADSNSVVRCAVKTSLLTTGFTSFAPIVSSSNNMNVNNAGNNANYLLIDSCTLVGGYYGVNLFNNSTPRANGNVIRNSVFINPFYYGVFAYWQNGIIMDNNVIINAGNGVNTFASPLYTYQCDNGIRITRNRMYGQAGGYGIYMFGNIGTSSSRNIIANNMIQIGQASFTSYGIYDGGSNTFTDIAHNTVNNTSADASYVSCALYYNYNNAATANNARIVNNIFTSPNGAMALWCTNTAALSASSMLINHNVYNSPSAYPFRIANTIFPTLATYRFAMAPFITNIDTNSIWTLPTYFSATNLRTISPSIDSMGMPLATVPTDIDGVTRNATAPDPGVNEFSRPTEDAGAIAILTPSKPVQPGLTNVVVVVQNFGLNTITSLNVSYAVDTLVRTLTYTGSIAPGATDTVEFDSTSGPSGANQRFNFTGGLVNMKAYTSNPNTVADLQNLNDTTSTSFCGALNGNYTINPSGTGPNNFLTIADAVNRLTCGGVTGNVTFNISNGTYTGQIDITTIAGTNSNAKVLFKSASNNAAGVIITSANATSLDNYTIRLRGAGFVNFEHLTVRNTNATFARVVSINKFATNNTNTNNISFRNCILEGVTTTSTADQFAVVFGPNGDNATELSFVKNEFRFGSYSIYLGGQNIINQYTPGLVIDSNFINQPYWSGIYLLSRNNPKVRDNKVNPSPSYGYYGLFFSGISGNVEVTGNDIQSPAGYYGIYAAQVNYYGEAGLAMFSNNAVNMTSSNTQYGIFYANGSNTYFMNNTLRLTSPTTSYALYIQGNTTSPTVPQIVATSNLRIVNNILYCPSSYAIYYANFAATSGTSQADNNLYYSTGANFAFVNGLNYAPSTIYTTFRNAVNVNTDRRSLLADMTFTSSTDLKPAVNNAMAWAANGRAQQTMFVPRDITGANRSTLVRTGAPDIGAFEFTPTVNPAPMTITGSIGGGNTQRMISYGDTVATLVWGYSGTLPTAISGTYHTGAVVSDPTNNGNNPNAEIMDVFWRITPSGGSLYAYDVTFTFDPNMLGTVPFMSDLKLAQKTSAAAGTWKHFGASMTAVDSVNYRFGVAGMSNDLGDFTGTTDLAPLPVTLSKFEAMRNGEDALLIWNTVSELNSKLFEVERAEDGKRFVKIGEIAAAGNSNKSLTYQFDDKNAVQIFDGKHVYYRLKMIDRDGSFAYSPARLLDFTGEIAEEIIVYPNPFKDQINLGFALSENAAVSIEIVDLFGKVAYKGQLNQVAGGAGITVSALHKLASGIYVIKVSKGETTITRKLIKD